jgi:hypothetical protein
VIGLELGLERDLALGIRHGLAVGFGLMASALPERARSISDASRSFCSAVGVFNSVELNPL